MLMDDWLCLFLEQLYIKRGGVSSKIGELVFASVRGGGFGPRKPRKKQDRSASWGKYLVLCGLVGFMGPGGQCAGFRYLSLEEGGFDLEVRAKICFIINVGGKGRLCAG